MLTNETIMHTQTPSLKLFPLRGRYAKSLMWGSLNVQTYIRPPSSMEVVSLTRNEYPHFNPAKYDVQVKIAKVRSGSHCLHNINYHFVWIPKYRKKLLTGKVRDILAQIIEGQWQRGNDRIAKLDGFKSAEEMFSTLDKIYNLGKPKQFWVYRWRWM